MIAIQSSAAPIMGQDDLAALLARNLTLNPVPAPVVAEKQVPAPAEEPKITYSISQHYHHSAHVARPGAEQQPQQQQQQQQQEPQQLPQSPEQQVACQQLMQHGIDPTNLSPVQLALFTMSAPDRRDYLVQLWRICPPARSHQAAPAATSIEEETALAQMRMQQQQQGDEAMSLDSTTVSVSHAMQPAQTADGRWLQSAPDQYMEPYMMSGYEELARREYLASASPPAPSTAGAAVPRSQDYSHSTDPVYNNPLWTLGGRASWPSAYAHSHTLPSHTTVDMENQYGALIAMRESSEMEL